ncbi:MAG TPA: peptide deformylase [Thermoanaerobaculia bacterium]|nr:peptide deformylase [Thermoanaerobaculia bacterium]
MAILPIRLYPDPVLRTRCIEVVSFDAQLERLVTDMVATMHAAPGIGLAASQVGVEQRVAVVDLSVGEDPEQVLVLVNPVLRESDGREDDGEGCLSIPDFTEKVSRASTVLVSARDGRGEAYEVAAQGLLARAIQHEMDHLDGVLFVDYLRGLRRERAKRHLDRLGQP